MKSNTKELVLYIIFGGLTTVVNIGVFYLGTMFGLDYRIANAIAWFISVVFAFITNKLYVFNSKGISVRLLIKELSLFFAARIFSLAVDMAGMIFLVEILLLDGLIAKILVNVIVIVLNYVLSKFIIFKK